MSFTGFNPYRIKHGVVLDANGYAWCVNTMRKCIQDLYDHDMLTRFEYERQIGALQNHVYHGILPGNLLYYSVYSGEMVRWGELVGDTMGMYVTACNWADLEEDGEDARDEGMSVDLYWRPFPTNIGVFRLYGTDPVYDGDSAVAIEDILNTTSDTIETAESNEASI